MFVLFFSICHVSLPEDTLFVIFLAGSSTEVVSTHGFPHYLWQKKVQERSLGNGSPNDSGESLPASHWGRRCAIWQSDKSLLTLKQVHHKILYKE